VSELRFESAGVLGAGLVSGLFLTTRITRIGAEHYQRYRDAGQPVMFVFWHGNMLPLVHYHRGEGIVVLVSEHGDGEYITRVLVRNGFGTARGSSTRGGKKGLKGLLRAARQGHDVGVSPDGPRGPRRSFKPGALAAAQMAGLPVVGIAVRVSSAWHVDSWDRFMVPRPFSHVTLEYLPPVMVPRDASREDLQRMAGEIGAELSRTEEL
jgi:lysophospholipid acyltransferase (LPLAT)-like uncharacterized protein